jgi:hypothetical protein
VRPLEPGDVPAVQELYRTIHGRERSLAEWRWRFEQPPAGPAAIHLVEQDGEVVGHIAHLPFPTWVEGTRRLLAHGGDTMVLRSFRGGSGMKRLLDTFLASAGRFDLRMNFPEDRAATAFERYGAGTMIGLLPNWIRRYEVSRPLPRRLAPFVRVGLRVANLIADSPPSRLEVAPLELGSEVDELAAASAEFAPCIRIRDAAYLRWRWLEQPGGHWRLLGVRGRQGTLRGLVVFGLEERDNRPSGIVVDLLARDARAMRALLRAACRELRRAGCGLVACDYLDPRPWARRVLYRSGFLPHGVPGKIICRSLGDRAGAAPESLASWYLTNGDTEPWPNRPPD